MINRKLSIYLDLVRFLAAVIVLLSHFGYTRYSGGRFLFIRELNLGSDAVVVFFVLSGLVIALTSRAKDKTGGVYTFNRATRIFSVAAPALALTFLLDRIGAAIDPAAYAGWWYNPLGLGRMLISGLTFTSEWTTQEVRLGTNGPYWSLSYEVAYYVLFGIGFFVKGARRWFLLALAAVVFGLKVMILAPAWLVGIWLYHRLQRSPVSSSLAPVLAIAPWVLYILMQAVEMPSKLTALTAAIIGDDGVAALRFSDEFVWNWILAVCFAAHLLGMSRWLVDKLPAEPRNLGVVRAIRWLAGASFSLYLVHYPVMQFFSAVLPKADIAVVDDAVLLGLTVVVCFAFAEVFERPLAPFRKWVRATAPSRKQDEPVLVS